MFGYIVADQAALTEEELARYRAFYCGLCRELGRRHGQTARMSLTYDMTFLILLLSSLEEPEEASGSFRCPAHPVKPRCGTKTIFTEYAADLSVALTYFKCLDDWQDEKKLSRRLYAGSLTAAYHRVRETWPRQCEAMEDSLREISQLEQQPDALLDDLARAFGKMMAEAFVYREDRWADTLRAFGDYLGRFIYVMDAVMDLEEDRKQGRYDPLLISNRSFEEMEEPLTLLIGIAAEQFESLPLVQDISILRNILYSGVWQRYRAEQEKRAGRGRKRDGN